MTTSRSNQTHRLIVDMCPPFERKAGFFIIHELFSNSYGRMLNHYLKIWLALILPKQTVDTRKSALEKE